MPRKSRFGANASDGLITQIPKRRAELKHQPRGAVTSAVTGAAFARITDGNGAVVVFEKEVSHSC